MLPVIQIHFFMRYNIEGGKIVILNLLFHVLVLSSLFTPIAQNSKS